MKPLLVLVTFLLASEAEAGIGIIVLPMKEVKHPVGTTFGGNLVPVIITSGHFRFKFPLVIGKIIEGHEAKPHSRPFMAYLQILNSDGNMNYCGGFLVHEDYVLTAAHCKGSSITVILGAHNIMMWETTQQRIPVRRAIPHPDYNSETLLNDIMLLQLERKANLNAYVSRLMLPKRTTWVRPRMVCSVAGWGRLSVNRLPGAEKLQEVELEIQKDELCIYILKRPYDITTQICAGDPKQWKASFKGDSGGPLVCDNVAQGIVSIVRYDGKPPGIYTRISSFMPWIENTMRHFSLQGPD